MNKKDALKLLLFIVIVSILSYKFFMWANQYYTPKDTEEPSTKLCLIYNKDTVVVHDTILNVKWKTKTIKVCCCSDSIFNKNK